MKIAVITSGGDASGVNAALYYLISHEHEYVGYHSGFEGIVNNQPIPITQEDVEPVMHSGELLIKSGRSDVLKTADGIEQVKAALKSQNVEVLVVFGGDGSAQGAKLLIEHGVNVIHIPMTIDNDIPGTDYTIGHKTAIENVYHQIGRLKQTGRNLEGRIFIVETFGGMSGQLTLAAGIASGADIVLLPEYQMDIETIAQRITELQEAGQQTIIILCTESAFEPEQYNNGDQGVVAKISHLLEKKLKVRIRQSILGYTQRSGNPNIEDILLAGMLGDFVKKSVLQHEFNFMAGMKKGIPVMLPLTGSGKGEAPLLIQEFVEIAENKKLILGERRNK